MRYLYVCNTTKDLVEKVNVEKFEVVDTIKLIGVSNSKVGPHGIHLQGDLLFTSNCYDSSASVVDLKDKNVKSFYLGRYCRDICAYGNHLYIICGDSNNVVNFDLIKEEIVEVIPCGDSPHSIDICNITNEILVANQGDDTITIFDALYGNDIATIKVGLAPTKALFTVDGDYILVCESCMGSMDKGRISVLGRKNKKLIQRIAVGNCPFDMYCDEQYCYVANYGDGSISKIDIRTFENISNIRIGGMPRGIVCDDKYIYVGDSYNNLLVKINKNDYEEKIIIPLGGQPTGMTMT